MKNPRVTTAVISAVLDNGEWYIDHGSAECNVSDMTQKQAEFYLQVFRPTFSPSPKLILELVRVADGSDSHDTSSPVEETFQVLADLKEKIRLHTGNDSPKAKAYLSLFCTQYLLARFGGIFGNSGTSYITMLDGVTIEYLVDEITSLYVAHDRDRAQLYYFINRDGKKGMMDVYVRNHVSTSHANMVTIDPANIAEAVVDMLSHNHQL